MSATAFPYGTLTRPFPPNPTSFVPKSPQRNTEYGSEEHQDLLASRHGSGGRASRVLATSGGEEGGSAWRQKQLEIRELQEANKSLMQRVSTSRSSTARGDEPQAKDSGLAASSSLPWPLPMPLPPPLPSAQPALLDGAEGAGVAGAALAAYLPADAGQRAGGRAQPRPHGGAEDSPSRAATLQGHLGLVEKVALLQEEVLELQRAAREGERALGAQQAKAQRSCEQLAEAERRNGELCDENAKLRNAAELFEQLRSGDEGASYKAVRNYIDGDLAAMRVERRDAEALLRVEAKRWEEAAERLQAQCEAAADRRDADASRIEALRSEHRAARLAAEEAAVCTDEAVERRLQRAKGQVESTEAAVQKLRQQLEVQGEENAKGIDRLRRSESYAANQQAQQDDLLAKLAEAERTGEAAETRLAHLERRHEAQRAEAGAECRRLQESLEAQEAAAAEERKRLRREAAKKVAEHQSWGSELHEEMEGSAARAKEAERGLHAKLSNARQERQRVEGKLRNQLQALQTEFQAERDANQESQEILSRWDGVLQEVSEARSERAQVERECSAMRQQHAQAATKMQKKNEYLHNELRAVCNEAKRAIQSEMLEERDRCLEEAWQRLSANEDRHSKHIEQLHEARETELGFISEQGRYAEGRLEQRIEVVESAAAARALLLEGESAQVEALSCAQEALRGELADARADAQGALEEHEALLEVLRREHEAADVQFQQLLLQAEEKQRKLGRLQCDGVLEDILEESAPYAQASPRSITTRCSTVTSRPLPSLAIPQSDVYTPRSSACGGSSARGAAENDGVDSVLRSLTRERELRRAQRLADEFMRVLIRAEQDSRSDQASGAEDKASTVPPKCLDVCRCLFRELLALYEQATHVSAEDDLRFAAFREKEAMLRAQLKRAEVRQASLRRMEMHGDEQEEQVEEVEASLERARTEVGEHAQGIAELQTELEQVRLESKRKVKEAKEQQERYCEEARAELQGGLRGNAHIRRMETQVEDLQKECKEEALEMREVKTLALETRSEAEAARIQERSDWLQEREELQRAHSDERGLLIAEIQQFQKEKYVTDESLRQHRELVPQLEAEVAEAEALLQGHHQERKDTAHRLRALELDEEECRQLRADAEAELSQELQDKVSAVQRAKEQLHAAREDRMKEKLRYDKQVERLRARVDALERNEAALEKKSELSERHEGRHMEEYAQRLDNSRREARHLGTRLQEVQLEEQSKAFEVERLQRSLTEAAVELGAAQERCDELATERLKAEAYEQVLCSEHRSLEAALASRHDVLQSTESWGKELSQRLQAVESNAHQQALKDRDAALERHQSLSVEAEGLRSELGAAHESTRQLHLNIRGECRQLLPLLAAEDAKELAEQLKVPGETSEAAFVQTLRAVARQVATLARENADLHHAKTRPGQSYAGSVGIGAPGAVGAAGGASAGAEATAKLATLQKELLKLREQNQELVHEKRLHEQRAASDLAVTASRIASDASGPRASSSGGGGGPENVYLRHQLKQSQQAKAKAEAEVEEHKQRTSSLQTELERLRAMVLEDQQRREAEQAQTQKRAQTLERKSKALEAKLQAQEEAHRQLAAEKENVERQLSFAAQQLEALLADEHKEGDLQRDLASLSKQVEHLHGKHRSQLAKAAEQSKQLQHEEALRSRLEEQLQEEAKKAHAIRQEESAREKELLAARSENSQLRSLQQQQTLAAQELEDEVHRLREELVQAKENNPRAREAVRHIKQKEAELGELREELERAEAARRRLQAEVRAQGAELEELRGALEASRGAPAGEAGGGRHQQQPRLPIAQGRSYERGHGGSQGREEQVLIRTAEDSGPGVGSQREQSPPAYPEADPNLALEDILTTLDSHERGLMRHKSSEQDSGAEVDRHGQGRPEASGASSKRTASGASNSLEEAQKDWSQLARSMGFNGDVETLWAEARARAAQEAPAEQQHHHPPQHSFDSLPVQGPPIAADVELHTVGKKVMRGYPDSPPGPSPDWPPQEEAAAPPPRPPQLPPGSGDVGAGAPPDSPAGPLLPGTQEAFRQAEALCEQHRFREAVPLFQRVVQAIEGGQEPHAPPAFVAEVWAHLGVAMQSLDGVPEAIRCYKKAVANDPSVHVCFANLATLHAYIGEKASALEYIQQAIALDPRNAMYTQIQSRLEQEGRSRRGPETQAVEDTGPDAGRAAVEAEEGADREGRG